MKYTLVFLEKAEEDIVAAFSYYETIQENLGWKFEEDLFQTIDQIEENPLHYRKVNGENRQLLMRVFSFVIIYQVVKNEILIARVFHTSRNPKYKYSRGKKK